MKNPDVLVIGAGLAGLVAGAILAKKGAKVLVIDELSQLGGRARTLEKDGFLIEYGPHAYLPQKSAFSKLCQELELKINWLEDEGIFKIISKQIFPLESSEKERVGKFLERHSEPKSLYRKTISSLGELDEEDKNLLNFFSTFFFAEKPEKLSAGELGEFLLCLSQHDFHFFQIASTTEVLINGLREIIEKAQGKIKLFCRALAIEIKGDYASSVETSEGELSPRAIVFTGAPSSILQIARENIFEANDLKKLSKISPACAVVMDFGLREKVCDLKGWLVEPELGIIGRFPSNIDPSIAPQDKQLSSWMIRLSERQITDPEAVRGAIRELRRRLKQLFEDFFALVEWERILVVPNAFGFVSTFQQSIASRLGSSTLIKNLFLAGDSLGFEGRGAEVAIKSAVECARLCQEFLGGER